MQIKFDSMQARQVVSSRLRRSLLATTLLVSKDDLGQVQYSPLAFCLLIKSFDRYSDMLIQKVNQSIHLLYESAPYRFLFVFLVALLISLFYLGVEPLVASHPWKNTVCWICWNHRLHRLLSTWNSDDQRGCVHQSSRFRSNVYRIDGIWWQNWGLQVSLFSTGARQLRDSDVDWG